MRVDEITAKTESDIRRVVDRSTNIMIQKNKERSDCWRATGLRGQFIDIHTCYNRLRTSIWVKGMPSKGSEDWDMWSADVLDSLRDMRNYTVLAELCLADNNSDGEEYWGEHKKLS